MAEQIIFETNPGAPDGGRLFVDMDGTLARFHDRVNYLERMWEPGFFRELEPFENMVQGLRRFMLANPETEVYILSSVISGDPPGAVAQKNEWLDKYLPEIDVRHRIFPPIGSDKTTFIPGGIRPSDMLLDDYNLNLEQWRDAGGHAVKFVNNINDRGLVGERWQGERLIYSMAPDNIAAALAVPVLSPEKAEQPQETLTPEKAAYLDTVFSYVQECRSMLGQGQHQLPDPPKPEDFDQSLHNYRMQVQAEIAMEAAAAGMTEEEYINSGYEYDTEPQKPVNTSAPELYRQSTGGMALSSSGTDKPFDINRIRAEIAEQTAAGLRGKELCEYMTEAAKTWRPNTQEYKAFLDFSAKFHKYSLRNTHLIYIQNEYASFVAGLKKFDEMGYSVNKGERGMAILAPYQVKMAQIDGEWHTLNELTDEQRALVSADQLKTLNKIYYKTVYVFDISQTNCPPEDIPKLLHASDERPDAGKYYEALKKIAQAYDICFREEALKSVTLKGYYSPESNTVTVNSNQTVTDKAITATHELSHALLHASIKESVPLEQMEFEAESSAYLTLKKAGFDMSGYRFRYIQDYLDKLEPESLQEALKHADNCSRFLSKRLMDTMPAFRQQTPDICRQRTPTVDFSR